MLKHKRRVARSFGLLAVLALFAALLPCGAAQAQAAPLESTMLADEPHYIVNANGLHLAASDSGSLILTLSGGNPRFYTVPDSGYVTYQSATGPNVGTVGNGTAHGTRVDLVARSGSHTQDWSTRPVGSGSRFFGIVNRASGRCLGISGGSSGTTLAIFDCDRRPNQQWATMPTS
jgi:hypothetical protein